MKKLGETKETTLTVTEMSRNFSEYMNRVIYRRESFVLTKRDKPFAEIRPLPRGITGEELLNIFNSGPRLSLEEAEAFGRDIDRAREELGTIADLADPWEN